MTLTLRARLVAISTIASGVLLAALGVVSYDVLARHLDADLTQRVTELTDGLHGYLRFDDDTASIAFDANDSDQAAFVREATRYYRAYDAESGRLLVESSGLAPLQEVRPVVRRRPHAVGHAQAARLRLKPAHVSSERVPRSDRIRVRRVPTPSAASSHAGIHVPCCSRVRRKIGIAAYVLSLVNECAREAAFTAILAPKRH